MLYVTGITGRSGRWFLNKLELEGYQDKIRVSMRKSKSDAPEKYSIFKGCSLDLEFAVGDLSDDKYLAESLKNVDTIIHTAGISLSPKIINAAVKNGVQWAILVHTTGKFSNYKSASQEYIKIEDEILSLRDSATNTTSITILRPTMIYGSSEDRNIYRLIEYLGKHKFFPLFGDGSNLMQPIHARDLGYAYYGVLNNPSITKNKEYNLSGKDPVSYLYIIRTICNLLKRNVKVIRIPVKASILAARIYNYLFKNAVITTEQVMRIQEDKAFSHDDAGTDFGFNPLPFHEGVKEEIQEYLSGVRIDYKGVKYQ